MTQVSGTFAVLQHKNQLYREMENVCYVYIDLNDEYTNCFGKKPTSAVTQKNMASATHSSFGMTIIEVRPIKNPESSEHRLTDWGAAQTVKWIFSLCKVHVNASDKSSGHRMQDVNMNISLACIGSCPKAFFLRGSNIQQKGEQRDFHHAVLS